MSRYGQRHALGLPVRFAVRGLDKGETGRSLIGGEYPLGDMTTRTDLGELRPSAVRNLDAAKINHHRALIQDADLLPAGS